MPTLVLDPPTAEFEALLERRRRLGADTHDEVWMGVLHMAPAPLRGHARLQMQIGALLELLAAAAGLETVAEFNLGHAEDYRVPDAALLPPGPNELYVPSATLVVEVVSPGDESWAKLPFYAAHGVDEALIVDPQQRTVHWLALRDGSYEPVQRSGVIDMGHEQLARQIVWP